MHPSKRIKENTLKACSSKDIKENTLKACSGTKNKLRHRYSDSIL